MRQILMAILAVTLMGSELTAQQQKPASPLPAGIVAAWEKAGAHYGWTVRQGHGYTFLIIGDQGKFKELPGFLFFSWQPGVIDRLPQPDSGFGLSLIGTKVTDAGLKELAKLKTLQYLDLGATAVTDIGLKELAGLKALQILNLPGTKVTDAGLKELTGLKSIYELNLNGAKVTDAGLKVVAGMKSLQTLGLDGAQVTDLGLKDLAGLVSLQTFESSAERRSPTPD